MPSPSTPPGDRPVVSVVVPAYDRGPRLPAVLDSTFAQAGCPPFEVLVVDDASTDDTAAVLAAYPRPVRVLRHPENRGVATARQTGLAAARGDLVAFHDSDDFMLPGRLGLLAAYLEAHPDVGAVYSNGIVERDGVPTGERVVPEALARRLDGRRIGIRDVVRDGLPMFLQTALVRRGVLELVGGVDTTLARHADLELSCRVVLATPTVFLDVPTFRYQLHGANQTRDRLKLREGLVAVMRRLRERRPEAVAELGARWFRHREARHLYRIARARWRAGEGAPASRAIREAIALQPANVRYRWWHWRIEKGGIA